MATIPFDEIVPGATVRFTTIDGVQFLSVRDCIMHISNKTPKRATEKWDRLSQELKDELAEFCSQHKFPGPGQSEQPVINFKGAIKLAMFLSGDNAAAIRSSMVNILSRYYSGDGSLINEIEDNAASSSAIAELARNSTDGAISKKRPRVSVEFFTNEVSAILKSMESGIAGHLNVIAAGQEDVVVKCTQMDAKQDNIYQKLYELTKELQEEKERNARIHREFSTELKARQNQIERQTAAISHLNNTIRAKDALLAKSDNTHGSIHQKLDTLLARNGA